jgi:hypothetical protein
MAGDRAGDNGVGPVAVGKNGEWLGDGDEAAMPIPGPLLTGATESKDTGMNKQASNQPIERGCTRMNDGQRT